MLFLIVKGFLIGGKLMGGYKNSKSLQGPLEYNPSLDSLRFICVLGVILCHWGPNSFANPIGNHILQLFHGGMFYVDIFFVLSGYLITHGLLVQKNDSSYTFKKSIILFYIKKFRSKTNIFITTVKIN